MSVRRFRSVEEMKREAHWRAAGTPGLWQAIARVWDLGRRTAPRRFPPGVYRHRSIESLEALSEQWAEAQFREHQRAATLRETHG
jgi:hypothetical protein